MAKARKQRNDEQHQQQREDNSGAAILHQSLFLFIDMDRRLIYGHTEMKVAVTEVGYIALHAENMSIRSITLDGEPAEFQLFPQAQYMEDEQRWCTVSCSQTAADVACSTYISSLDKEMVPNLIIKYQASGKMLPNQEGQINGPKVSQTSSGEQEVNGHNELLVEKNVKLVRIQYLVEKAETGISFNGNVLSTDNQLRRARCWFPCMDSIVKCCTYHLEFTVNSNFVAVSNGNLLYQVSGKDDLNSKTYVYDLDVPVCASWITLTVAPFEILTDSQNSGILNVCLPSSLSKLQNTVGFFHNAFSCFEDYLSMTFPFGCYKQIFIPPEICVSPASLGASMCIFSSSLLFDEKVIDKAIDTRIRLAYALAKQWFGVYISAEEPTDEWLVEGLAGFLTDLFIKRFLGNNEVRYRRYKANCSVCKVDISGATALGGSITSQNLYGTQSFGNFGKIRSWKAVAVLQMLEKQTGTDPFRKILQNIVSRTSDTAIFPKTLSTKEFKNLANKIGNLERPFLKEFFPRWVEACGCPTMRMAVSYNKRRNIIEFPAFRDCTTKIASVSNDNPDRCSRECDIGWPGMMTIRVHEIDGMYDHPSLPMSGEVCQLLEIQCHSKLAAKRIQKPKKGSKPDGTDEVVDASSALDNRNVMDSPLLWLRVDPEMEFLVEIQFAQPIQMWINQLEKDKDVVAQSQAITTLKNFSDLSFSTINALNAFLIDSKAFWRVRIEAAFALANTSSEDTDYAGLLHLVKFYKNRRFDISVGLPRPNNFHDVPEYFVLEAIPEAVALVRTSDQKSPREAVEFLLQLLKYNDNNGNPFSDAYWLSALVHSIGQLEFGSQNIVLLRSLLKHIDRLLQFDRLMPSYNGILAISCIHTLVQLAVKFSEVVPSNHVYVLIIPFRNLETVPFKVRIEASRGLLDMEYYLRGLDAALSLFIKFLEEESSLRGEIKLASHAMHLCKGSAESESRNEVGRGTLVTLLCLLASRRSFNNVFLRHYLFCILQIIAGRSPTLYGAPRTPIQSINTSRQLSEEQQIDAFNLKLNDAKPPEFPIDAQCHLDSLPVLEAAKEADTISISSDRKPSTIKIKVDSAPVLQAAKEADTISISSDRKPSTIKIKVKQPSSSSKADGADNVKEPSQGGGANEAEFGPSSSLSVDAPARMANEALNVGTNIEEVNSSHCQESRITVSIGSAKLQNNDETKEFLCTADSRNSAFISDQLSPSINGVERVTLDKTDSMLATAETRGHGRLVFLFGQGTREEKKRNKDKKRKRKRDDNLDNKRFRDEVEYSEHKRRKEEKKRLKELAKLHKQLPPQPPPESLLLQQNLSKEERLKASSSVNELMKQDHDVVLCRDSPEQTKIHASQAASASASGPRIKLKITNRNIAEL